MSDLSCRSCGGTDLRTFLDLGQTPLPDALVDPAADRSQEEWFPLAVAFCPGCTLVQITEEVSAEKMFVDNYHYYSSFSDHLLKHSRDHALGLVETRGLGDDSLVVELASNDGYLLKNFVEVGVPVLGIDPSPGPAAAAGKAGVPTLQEFFGVDLARRLVGEGRRADVIIANNVMAHVPDLNGFVAGMKLLLADDGLITVENPYVRDLVDHCEFDTVYHEHYCYFSCTSVQALMRRHGLWLNDVEYFENLHGGTLRWHIGHHDRRSDTLVEYLREEQERGLTGADPYLTFADRVRRVCTDLAELIGGLRAEGRSVAAYGAAAKGAMTLNHAGLGTDLVEFVVDRNPHKQGKLMPGTHQPVRSPDALITERPDYVLLLAWNFRDEIMAQQVEYLDAGGRFIVPVPTPEVVA
ncbi:MAG: class I SAM-dependent methyltransferase [Acidimicrobiales bacterium]